MSNENTGGSGLKIGLVVVSILLVISLIANVYFYTRQFGASNGSGLESQVANLQTQVNSLTNDKNNLQSQVDSLQNQVNSLKAPKLITRLGATDNNPLFGSDNLHITGEVWNVGTDTANNVKLHVKLYHGNVATVDSYIELGTLGGESYKDVDEQVFYSGDPLDSWNIDLEWD